MVVIMRKRREYGGIRQVVLRLPETSVQEDYEVCIFHFLFVAKKTHM